MRSINVRVFWEITCWVGWGGENIGFPASNYWSKRFKYLHFYFHFECIQFQGFPLQFCDTCIGLKGPLACHKNGTFRRHQFVFPNLTFMNKVWNKSQEIGFLLPWQPFEEVQCFVDFDSEFLPFSVIVTNGFVESIWNLQNQTPVRV